jgi:uncharacterized protein YhbP (UPF0306 family)
MSLDIEKIIREYMGKTIHMSLGTCRDGKPWVCEVHFAYDDELNLYFRSEPTRRHCQEIAQNPQVAGNIVKQHLPAEAPHGIYFEGTAKWLADEAQRQAAFPYFQKCQQSTTEILDKAKDPAGTQFYKITVQNWYAFGDFGDGKTQKYELAWNGGKK